MADSRQPQPAVTIKGLVKRFGSAQNTIAAIDGIDLEIVTGQRVALTGASGSGKSTLLHLLGAIERADEGVITVGEQEITGLGRKQLARFRQSIGFVFQSFHLLPALTALDNVLMPVLPRRVDFDREERARELLDAVGLKGRHRAVPGQLSGGQQQRVAIARALIGQPSVLLADEPTGALDSATSDAIMDLLCALADERECTLIIATHEESVADRADRTLVLRDGRISADTGRAPAAVDQ